MKKKIIKLYWFRNEDGSIDLFKSLLEDWEEDDGGWEYEEVGLDMESLNDCLLKLINNEEYCIVSISNK